MKIELTWLLLGLVLLWCPRRWLRFGASFFRRRGRRKNSTIVEPWRARETGDPRVSMREEFGRFRNYVDLLRAAAGGLLLFGGMGIPASLALASGSSRSVAMQVLVLRAAILLIGLLLQAVRRENGRFTFFPPIFYLGGLSVALVGVQAAGFAFVLIWGISPALPSAHAFLSIYALLMVAFGVLFTRLGNVWAIYAGLLCYLPVLLSLLAKRPLIIPSGKGTHVRKHA